MQEAITGAGPSERAKARALVMLGALLLLGGCQAIRPSAASSALEALEGPTANGKTPELSDAGKNAAAESPFLASQIPATTADTPSTKSEIQLASANVLIADQSDTAAAEIVSPGNMVASQRMTLIDAINTSLAQNPDLVVLRTTEGVSHGALGVARTYPFNPYVQIQTLPYRKFPEGQKGWAYNYVLLMQTLQWGHQQRYRKEGALNTLQSVQWNIHQAELLNLAQTERLYFTALYQRSIRDLVTANASLSDELKRVLECQLQAGQASAADLAIVQLDNQSTRMQAQLAEANFQTALLDLRRQLNLPSEAPLELADELVAWQWHLPSPPVIAEPNQNGPPAGASPEEVITQYAGGRPDVMAARSDVATAQANLGLANGNRRPDLQIGPLFGQNEDGVILAGLRAQADIPVINSGMPLVRQREAELTQRIATWQQLQCRADLEARNALQRYQRALRIASQPGGSFQGPPLADLNKLEEQLKANEVDFLRVFTARTSLLQLRRAHLDALNELAQSAANLTAATGIPPDALLANRAADSAPAQH
jgi:cobalt-zinc-cadmium efflux system outer membrane protein